MRIIAGENRGTLLADVGAGDLNAALRPTPDRVRESLFSMLTSGKYGAILPGARVLDLFAGTGALGLEALSRGAAHCTFVDDGRVALRLIRQNIRKLRRQDQTDILPLKAVALPPAPAACGLVFMDPPYGQRLGPSALDIACDQGWIVPGAIVSWEERTPQTPPPGFDLLEQRRFGDTWITLLRAP